MTSCATYSFPTSITHITSSFHTYTTISSLIQHIPLSIRHISAFSHGCYDKHLPFLLLPFLFLPSFRSFRQAGRQADEAREEYLRRHTLPFIPRGTFSLIAGTGLGHSFGFDGEEPAADLALIAQNNTLIISDGQGRPTARSYRRGRETYRVTEMEIPQLALQFSFSLLIVIEPATMASPPTTLQTTHAYSSANKNKCIDS